MLQVMRNNMKVVLWVTIIFFVLLIFLVWGADLEFGDHRQPNSVGTVNGDPVTVTAYQQLLSYNRRNVQSQGQELQPTDELQLEEQTWNAIVDELLMRQEAAHLGITAHNAEIRAILLNDPPAIITQDPNFQNQDGQFDMATYRSLLQDPSTPETFLLQLENYVRDSLPVNKLRSIVASGAKVTDDELRRAYEEENEKAVMTYVVAGVPPRPADQQVSDAELSAWFEAHQEDYRLPARVDLHYVSVPRVPTAADSASILADITDYAQEAREAQAAEDQGAENLDKSDFAALAQTFSDAPSAEDGGLTEDYLTRSQMSPRFAEAIQGLEPGQVSAPFQDGPYYHILQVVGVKEEKDEPATQLRDLALRIQPSDSTVQDVTDQLEALRTQARSQGLAAAAQAAGLEVEEAPNVSRGTFVPGLSAIPRIGEWAHDNPEGTLSRIMSASNAWFVIEVGAHKPAGIPALDEVRDRVRADYQEDRLKTRSKEIIERVAARIRGGETLEQAAEAESLTVTTTPEFGRKLGIPGFGRDLTVTGTVFSLPVGQVSEPLDTRIGWALIRVDSRTEPDWDQFDKEKDERYRALLAAKQNRLVSDFLDALRQKAKIVDYRGA